MGYISPLLVSTEKDAPQSNEFKVRLTSLALEVNVVGDFFLIKIISAEEKCFELLLSEVAFFINAL